MSIFRRKQKETHDAENEARCGSNDYMKYGIRYLLKHMRFQIDEEVGHSVRIENMWERMRVTGKQMEEVQTVIDEINRNYMDFQKYADQIQGAMEESDSKIGEADTGIDQLTEKVGNSRNQLTNMVQTFDRLENDFQNILSLTSDISGISFSTNLLALNAGIEAARAGEAGRGFSVVADQIRELSASTSSLVKRIDQSISVLRETIYSLHDELDKTSSMMQSNIEYAGGLRSSMEQVKECSGEVKKVSGNIIQMIGSTSGEVEKENTRIEAVREAVETISEEIGSINKKAGEKSVALGEMEDILTQMNRILKEA